MCNHKPDFYTIFFQGVVTTDNKVYLQIKCKKCKKMGDVWYKISDVMWPQEEDTVPFKFGCKYG